MSEKETRILERMRLALSFMPDVQKEYLLGLVDGMAIIASATANQNVPLTAGQQSGAAIRPGA